MPEHQSDILVIFTVTMEILLEPTLNKLLVDPNDITFLCVLSACTHVGLVEEGRVYIGLMRYVYKIDQSPDHYACMVDLLGRASCLDEVFDFVNLDPNDITFFCVLSVCTHVGLVEEERVYIGLMRYVYKIDQSPDQYACMVDLLGRASCFDEAFDFVNSILFEPHSRVFGVLLSASRTHCRLDLAQIVARHISELEPDNATAYVILSDIYLFLKKKDDEELVRTLKRLKGIKKSHGCNLITIKDDVNLFLSGDRSYMNFTEIKGTSSIPLREPAPTPMLSADDLLAYERQLAMSKMATVHVALMHPQAQVPLKQTIGMSGTEASQAIYDGGFHNVVADQQLMYYQ
uniref:Uncharacterized protein n=1 Tax=Tanacetum cinerariifolium TaxID=118510 RepID=A0A6L2KCY4_TANCI|nr:hypothetical protein [Tanacetum cinerariifolium]